MCRRRESTASPHKTRFAVDAAILGPVLPALLMALAMPAEARAETGTPPERESTIIVYGDDPCPRSADEDEIVVCAREPETERYRVPKRFRDERPEEAPAVQSWASRVDAMDQETRWTRPNSCSVVGTGGQSGCTAEMLRRWYLERKAMAAEENAWRE